MRPIFRRCTNFSSSVKHEHQPLEGNAGTFGSRTKLAQVYPYQFCQDLAHILLRHLQVKPLDNEVYLLEDLFEPFTIKQVDILRKEMEAIDKEFNMTSSSLAVRMQDLPFNKDVQPLVIQDPLVQKFRKTMKQYPPGTDIDIFKQDPNDWRCQNMWNGCKKLRQLCISSTQYDACTAYVHTIGINMPITSPPDDAIISFWQPDQLNRIWVLPASKCNWEKYDPKTWHAVMFSSVHQSFTDAPAIKPRIRWIQRMHLNSLTRSSHLISRTIPCLIRDLQRLRTRTCQILLRILHISLIIPCRQHHAVCDQTVQRILHYRHTTSLAEEMQRLNGKNSPFHPQVGSIDWGVMSLCRHSRNHPSQFFRLSWYLHHLRFLQIPKQKNEMKILNCQHLRKKKQPAVHQRSRRLGGRRRRSQMTMMSHLSILPDMILHLHPIIVSEFAGPR